jgi:hypothetical protein
VELIPIFELSVAEAHAILVDHFGLRDLPPLEALEYEDWGRDLLLSRLADLPADQLATAGLTTLSRFSNSDHDPS